MVNILSFLGGATAFTLDRRLEYGSGGIVVGSDIGGHLGLIRIRGVVIAAQHSRDKIQVTKLYLKKRNEPPTFRLTQLC